MGDETGVRCIATDGTPDADGRADIEDRRCIGTLRRHSEAGGKAPLCVDGASYAQVTDGGSLQRMEGCQPFGVRKVGVGAHIVAQRMAAAVEGTLEGAGNLRA